MLKGRSKTFAPKKGPIRRPAAPTPAPTRPSEERSSQTPAPTNTAEAVPVPQNEQNQSVEEPQVAVSKRGEARAPPKSNNQVSGASIAQTVHKETNATTSSNLGKRKSQGDGEQGPAQKRVTVEGAEGHVAAPGQGNTEAPTSSTLANTIPQDTSRVRTQDPTFTGVSQRTSPASDLTAADGGNHSKRKAPENEVAQPPAKRVSTDVERPQSLNASIHATSDASATRRAVPGRQPSADSSTVRTGRAMSTDISHTAEEVGDGNGTRDEQQDGIVPTIERTPVRSPSPNRRSTPEPLRYRYPSPEVIASGSGVRMFDPGNMGPPGAMGAAGSMGPAGLVEVAGPIVPASQTAARSTGIGGESPRVTREVIQVATLNPDGTSQVVAQPASVEPEQASNSEADKNKKKAKKPAKKAAKKVIRKKNAPAEVDGAEATIDMGARKARKLARKRVHKKRQKDGDEEEEEAEDSPSENEREVIDREKMTMEELCVDLKIGKKSHIYAVIKERERMKKQERSRNRLREEHPELVPALDAEDEDDEARLAAETRRGLANAAAEANGGERLDGDDEVPGEAAEEEPNPAAAKGPVYRVVDGEIVLDQQSMAINRQAEGAAARADMEEVEENDFSKLINSGTYMKKEKNQTWDEAATDQFYDCLNQYGTDFYAIAATFPHRSRRQIKLKFNAEEKRNPAKITKYMTMTKKAIDLEEFEQLSGMKLESKEYHEAYAKKIDEEQEALLKAKADKDAEEDRAKKAEIEKTSKKREAAKKALADANDIDGDDQWEQPTSRERGRGRESSKENSNPAPEPEPATKGKGKGKTKAKKAPKPRKNKHSMYGGGEEVIIEGPIDY